MDHMFQVLGLLPARYYVDQEAHRNSYLGCTEAR